MCHYTEWQQTKKIYRFPFNKEMLHTKKSKAPLMSIIQGYVSHISIFPGNLLLSQTLYVQWTWMPGHLLGISGRQCSFFYTLLSADMKPNTATACHFVTRESSLKWKKQYRAEPSHKKQRRTNYTLIKPHLDHFLPVSFSILQSLCHFELDFLKFFQQD